MKIKEYLISVILIFFIETPLFGQSSDEKRFTFRTALIAHALTYNLDMQNAVGFHFGQFSTEINEDNVNTLKKNFYGFINIIRKFFKFIIN